MDSNSLPTAPDLAVFRRVVRYAVLAVLLSGVGVLCLLVIAGLLS